MKLAQPPLVALLAGFDKTHLHLRLPESASRDKMCVLAKVFLENMDL